MTREREGEVLMLGLTILESWFPILSIVAMSYVGAMHTYMYSLIIAFFSTWLLCTNVTALKSLKIEMPTKTYCLQPFG